MRRLVPLLALLLLTAGCARLDGQPFQPTVTKALRLTTGHTLGQTLRTGGSPVNGIDLLIATFGETPPPDAQLHVAVLDPADGTLLWDDVVTGDELADNTWVRASGAAAAAPEIAQVEVSLSGQAAVGLWANIPPDQWTGDVPLNDPYPGGELVVDGFRAPGDLAFRATTAAGPVHVVGAGVRLARSAGSRLLDAPLFALVWLLLVGGAVALAARGLRRSRPVVQLDQGRPGQEQREDQEPGAQHAGQALRQP